MGCSLAFSKQAAKLVSAIEAHGDLFLRASQADISVGQYEELLTEDILTPLTDLPHMLVPEPLSLRQARWVYKAGLLDTLCSILSRLQWTGFCNELDALAVHGRGFTLANSGLDCMLAALILRWRVYPPLTVTRQSWRSSAGANVWQETSSKHSSVVRPVRRGCAVPRFESMVPLLHRVALSLAQVQAAVARTSERAHAGVFALANMMSSLQQACACGWVLASPGISSKGSSRRRCSCCAACRAHTVVREKHNTNQQCASACADNAAGGAVLPSRGRELPVRQLCVAAAGAGLRGAGAQPVRGGGGVAAGGSHPRDVCRTGGTQLPLAAGAAAPREALAVRFTRTNHQLAAPWRRAVGPAALSQSSAQHMRICETLYDRMASPFATEALRSAFIAAMCEEVTSDLLCWSMEKGLDQGDVQAGPLHARSHRALAAARCA